MIYISQYPLLYIPDHFLLIAQHTRLPLYLYGTCIPVYLVHCLGVRFFFLSIPFFFQWAPRYACKYMVNRGIFSATAYHRLKYTILYVRLRVGGELKVMAEAAVQDQKICCSTRPMVLTWTYRFCKNTLLWARRSRCSTNPNNWYDISGLWDLQFYIQLTSSNILHSQSCSCQSINQSLDLYCAIPQLCSSAFGYTDWYWYDPPPSQEHISQVLYSMLQCAWQIDRFCVCGGGGRGGGGGHWHFTISVQE